MATDSNDGGVGVIYSLEAKRAFAAKMRNRPTAGESALWECLRKKQTGFVFHRQSCQLGFILDFYCARLKLAIEVDGSLHHAEADARKDLALRARGIKVLRFTNRHILDFCSDVMTRILSETAALEEHREAQRELEQPWAKFAGRVMRPPTRQDERNT